MNCPKCTSQPLVATQVRQTQVDRCKTCGGIWFDQAELNAVLKEEPGALGPLKRRRQQDELNRQPARCPRDGAPLMRVCSASNPNVVLDACSTCQGIWLDGGELEKL